MPRHKEGFRVALVKSDGTRIREYHNPNGKVPKGYTGSFTSRVVVAKRSAHFSVVVQFDHDFKLYSATGVVIQVKINARSSQLSRRDNFQEFWLSADQVQQSHAHKISSFLTWEEDGSTEPSRLVPMEMPSRKAHEAGERDYLVDDEGQCCRGSIAVWMYRAKVDNEEYCEKPNNMITLPPPELRHKEIDGIKVIDHYWYNSLKAMNGRPYLFMFINRGRDAIARNRSEDLSVAGYDDYDRYYGLPMDDSDFEDDGDWDGDGDGEEYNDSSETECETTDEESASPHGKKQRGGPKGGTKRARAKQFKACSAGNYNAMDCCEDKDDEEDWKGILPRGSLTREPLDAPQQTAPTDDRAARETTEDLYGVTPGREVRPPNNTSAGHTNAEANHESERYSSGSTEDVEMEDVDDFQLQLEIADIEKEHKIKVAKIKAKQQAHQRRLQAN